MSLFAARTIRRFLELPISLHVRGRTGSSGYVFFISIAFAAVLASPPTRAQNGWQKTAGPPGVSVKVLYKSNNVLYAGTVKHGVYRSEDNGKTWTAANQGIERADVGDIIQSGPNLLAAASAISCSSSVNVFKSTDNGTTWAPTSGLSGRVVRTFAIKGNFVYAGFSRVGATGLYRSSDNGNTWVEVASPITHVDKIFVNDNAIIVADSNFIWRSLNDGASWQLVEQFALSGLRSFARAGTKLFAAGNSGLWTSNDDGASWDQVVSFPDSATSVSSDGSTIYLGSNSKVYRSTDMGANWTEVSSGLGKGVIVALLFDGANVFAGTPADGAGVYRTSNGGQSWTAAAAGLPIGSEIRSLVVFGGKLFAGTDSDGVYVSADRGNTWSKVDPANTLLGNQIIFSFCVKGNSLFVGATNGIYRSTDGGITFQRTLEGFPANINVTAYSLTVSGQNLLAAARISVSQTQSLSGIYYSSDNGASWHNSILNADVTHVSVVASDGDQHAYAGVYTQNSLSTGLYRSTDGGLTWSFPFSLIVDIERMAVKSNNVLASTLFTAYFSRDFGEAVWAASSLPGSANHGGVYTYTLDATGIYAGNEGMYRSDNGGASWTPINNGFPGCPVPVVLASASDGNYLYAGTTDEGVWRRLVGAAPAGSSPAAFDFDGDHKADISVRRPSDNTWYMLRTSAGYTAMTFGVAGDLSAPADFDGDEKTDIAIFRPSENRWYIAGSRAGFYQVNWGIAGDIPVPADYDGDHKADVAIYRPSNGTWYIIGSTAGQIVTHFGTPEDKPYPADYDGDGKVDIAVRRPSDNNWYLLRTTAGFTVVAWGINGDLSAPADFDGDGKTDLAVLRPSTGTWFVFGTTRGQYTQSWGQTGDIPVAADYDGDAKADIAVFRPSNSTWYIIGSRAGIIVTNFGQNGDAAIESVYGY